MSNREIDATTAAAKVSHEDFIKDFGATILTKDVVERVKRLTGMPAHPFIRRGLYFCHRDFTQFLDAYEAGKCCYIYTGRGPSSMALHLGHMIPFIFCAYLQKAFKIPIVIQMTDDEKLLRDKNLTYKDVDQFAYENIRDIIACGFELERTFIFLNSSYIGNYYRFLTLIERSITFSQMKAAFGFQDSTNTGYAAYPPRQIAPAFPQCFQHIFNDFLPKEEDNITDLAAREKAKSKKGRVVKDKFTKESLERIPFCLIPCGKEQDPYFRLARDISQTLGANKPVVLYNSFIPALCGDDKMSASDPNNSVYMMDTPKEIKTKINKYAFSGGQPTAEEQREKGANVDVDVSIKYLEVFMADDQEFEQIKEDYRTGKLLTGEVKGKLIALLQDITQKHQERKNLVTKEMVEQFTAVRPLKIELYKQANAEAESSDVSPALANEEKPVADVEVELTKSE